ncbi:hypothetical protein KFK09_027790 [Dendrobium nobile]|uniref:Uncharacterized protein n=1 Tax=Dendrobium nobile TaxID=94219 RepID=A0A8T3A1C6_DENNO|nr:hypothetical protein KFK09_027790 [Dendrobium nobile]
MGFSVGDALHSPLQTMPSTSSIHEVAAPAIRHKLLFCSHVVRFKHELLQTYFKWLSPLSNPQIEGFISHWRYIFIRNKLRAYLFKEISNRHISASKSYIICHMSF